MTKIEKVKTGIEIAGYDLENDTIYYDERLDDFPKLKARIIAHEQYHADNKEKLLCHMWNDIKDLRIFCTLDFYNFFLNLGEKPKIKKKMMRMYYYYFIFNIIRNIVVAFLILPTFIILTFWYIIYGIFGREKKNV